MTKEEAIAIFKGFKFLPREMKAVEMAIKALEQESITEVSIPHKIAEFFSNWDGDENAKIEISVNDMREIASIYGKKARLERQLKEKALDYNTDEWCHDCKEYDHDKHCCPRYNKVIRNTVEEMKRPCDDAISRADALLEISSYFITEEDENGTTYQMAYEDGINTAYEAVEKLPPVQLNPKVGHWIFDEILDRNYYCSECKSMGVDYWDYCPYCGCRMVEPQESEEV